MPSNPTVQIEDQTWKVLIVSSGGLRSDTPELCDLLKSLRTWKLATQLAELTCKETAVVETFDCKLKSLSGQRFNQLLTTTPSGWMVSADTKGDLWAVADLEPRWGVQTQLCQLMDQYSVTSFEAVWK